MPPTFSIAEVKFAIQKWQLQLDQLILAEPTGQRREQLTEANIHLMSAISNLEDAQG